MVLLLFLTQGGEVDAWLLVVVTAEGLFAGLLFQAGGLEVVYCGLLAGFTRGGLEGEEVDGLFLVQGGEELELLLFLR